MIPSLFVTGEWLAEHLNDPEIQILDARMAPPGQEHRDVPGEYRSGHLPGAVYFDIEALSDRNTTLAHMMPRPEAFAVAMRELGVCSDRHLVVYDEGDLFCAPRAWWMLKTFGVQNISILAGGLAGWKAALRPLIPGDVTLPEGEFEVKFDTSAIKRLTDILLISHEGGAQLVDARPAPRFNAQADEPRPGLRRGHIPGARNVPWGELVEQGQLKDSDTLRAIFQKNNVDLQQPIIVSCGSGVTAAVVALALHTLGVTDVKLYDGSWSEWGARIDLPVEPAGN
ncbi:MULTISPECIES: 3-mercaptopyruvate sulfurtransferase [Tenebrionibacter/Tenebrionicola group]|jgi:thiosulfate/3-mercaptopyruvate sulfurtransferase|uniref:Sulfurtransferase n=2 Tax=Tenebrionibacter/Tenebrionicola group TaxID=2969848 RepID=A0A8K0V226_9ENTR|nr:MULTISPECIES: 3-mercaptopyruvate sulfurtransferase [Tenebrionibacter/Tenebrionicola group]MBK4716034.1 3-mercaptopyruvate sulfurtransferase [Tenebrionibacter intestinalis]MBV4411739.1 3-mercaptopyruvate sulfurtransferase [Tenebrionicola larvae]MBV5096776.1 3-mercaptopyruvate sulfurtransferase [Tenebrionicola larvae]